MPRTILPAAGLLLIALLASSAAAAETRTVTLITGDRVVIGDGEQPSVTVQARKGREGIAFSTTYRQLKSGRNGNHLFVIPADAMPLIGSGRLDRQLFDVTTLLKSHYHDGEIDHVPVVVTYKPRASAAFVTSASLAGAAITNRFDSVNGVAATVDKEDAGHFWDSLTGSGSSALSAQNNAVEKIWLDRMLYPVLDVSVPQIGAPTAWQSGYDGTGVVVAIIDTGVDTSHPDLVGKVLAEKNFVDTVDRDTHGHGTHVASTVAGTGAASNGRFRGVAPGAQLISAKVCNALGCALSGIMAAMHWAVEEQGVRLINMSLSGEINTPGVDPLEQALDQLTARYGALFVVAAGNNGTPLPIPGALGIESPGSAAAALTVAAVDRTGQMADFSSRGPLRGDYRIKPDISAPGVNIVAARADGTRMGEPVGDSYVTASGTSMAAPHVAGAAAILLQRYPNWTPEQLKSALMSTARFNPAAAVIDQGAGFIDVPAALTTAIVPDTSSMSLGIAEFPHDDDPILTRTVTYRNSGNLSISLSFQLDVRGPNGAAAPAGMFTLDRSVVTVPAGGTGTVTLSTNTRVSAPFGLFTGRLIATGGGKTLGIPLGVYREEERYNFSLQHIDRNGAPAAAFNTVLVPLDQDMIFMPMVDGDGTNANTTLRVPGGRYVVQTQFYDDSRAVSTLLLHPGHLLNAPVSLTLDARNAAPLTIAAPTSTAFSFWSRVEFEASAVWGTHSYGVQWTEPQARSLYTGVVGQPAEHIRSYVSEQWRDGSSSTGDAALYAAVFTQNGTLVTGAKTIPVDQMSVVRARYAPAPVDSRNQYAVGAMGVGADVPGFSPTHVAFDRSGFLPQQRTEYYYSPNSDVRWSNELSAGSYQSLDAPSRQYQPGQMYFSRWNEAPFAPALPNYNPEVLWSYRAGDTMTLEIPLLADRQSHGSTLLSGLQTNFLRLYRNGEMIGDVQYPHGPSEFSVPPESADYRIEATVAQADFDPGIRQTIIGLSTLVRGAWTFQSGHVTAGSKTQLPLMTVRFNPTLNEHGEAVRGPSFKMPVSVHQLDRQGTVDVPTLKIDASFDEGASWSEVQLERNGSEWIATLQHPEDASYVSLRASAQGPSANSAEITVIRAYALTNPAPSAR